MTPKAIAIRRYIILLRDHAGLRRLLKLGILRVEAKPLLNHYFCTLLRSRVAIPDDRYGPQTKPDKAEDEAGGEQKKIFV